MPYPYIDDNTGDWLSVDGALFAAAHPAVSAYFAPSDESMYYEVIRVQDGVPLFWQDHMKRLLRSVDGAFPVHPDRLLRDSADVAEQAGLDPCNLRIVLTKTHTVIHLSSYYYPTDDMIRDGVDCGLLQWERETPNVKTIRADYKQAVARAFASAEVRPFEVLLADRSGFLTEGSRTNLFFIRDGVVISAPDDRILLGITRRHVQEAVTAAGCRMETGLFTMADLEAGRADAAFLTGSPIDILPIARIGGVSFDVSDTQLRAVHAAYRALVDAYIRDNRTLLQQDPSAR